MDPQKTLFISGFQMLNHIYNAEVEDKTKNQTFNGTLTNFLYQGYGSLIDKKMKIEYRGYFNEGKKMGKF